MTIKYLRNTIVFAMFAISMFACIWNLDSGNLSYHSVWVLLLGIFAAEFVNIRG